MDDIERGQVIQQIEGWIRKNVAFPDLENHGKCTKVVIRHLSVDRKPQGDVASIPVRFDGDEDEIGPLVNNIADLAQQDADAQNQGLQLYAIYAYYSKDQTYVPRKPFRVAGASEMDRELNPSEPPTEKGLVAQTMRHLEAVMKTSAVSMGYAFQAQQQEIRRLSEVNAKYAETQLEYMVLLQDTLNDRNKRLIEEREAEAALAMKEGIVTKLEALLPVVINRIAGTPILPEEDKSFMLMASFLERLSDDQQLQFFNSLNEAQRITFGEILAEYEKKKSKWTQKEKTPVQLGKAKSLSLPGKPGEPKQIAAKGEQVLDDDVKPIPMFLTLSERIASMKPTVSSSPEMQQVEEDAGRFAEKFKDLINGSKR